MIIQDLIFAIGSVVFVVALLFSVFSDHKPSLSTSILTAGVLFVFAATYFTMSFYFACVVTAITATLWSILAVQKVYMG